MSRLPIVLAGLPKAALSIRARVDGQRAACDRAGIGSVTTSYLVSLVTFEALEVWCG
jgi:hypothetical protein